MATSTCTGGGLSCWMESQGDILANIAKSIPALDNLVTGGAYIIGIMFVFKALFSLKIYGEARTMMSSNTSIKEPLAYLFVGAMLIYLPSAVEVMLQTTFGYQNILQYATMSSNSVFSSLFDGSSMAGRSMTMIIQFIGLVAFVRGWILIARSASQGQPPGGTGKGLVHVFGGILAMNIVGTMEMINNTLYGS